MAANSTDKFRKLSRRWVGQIGSGGVADASTTTVPLTSATNLATDTGVTVVIDRVDVNGVATASLEETVVGVVSGSNLVSCVRGVEGTAQAHSAGAVVEVLVTADGYNDMIDGFLVEHTQLGAHASALALTSPVLTTPQINDTSSDHQYVIAVSELTADRIVTLPLLTAADEFVFKAHTQTLTNKRVTKRVVTTTDDATAVIDVDVTDVYELSAVANATTFTLSGTPTSGQTLIVKFKDAGVAKGLTWTGFTAIGITLPTTTVASKQHYVGCIYNGAATRWEAIAAVVEA